MMLESNSHPKQSVKLGNGKRTVMSDIEAIVADTETARRLHYQLRYQVYCLETGFEEASRYPDHKESDEYDNHATHFLMRGKQSGVGFAAARLVLPGDRALPVESLYEIPKNHISKIHGIPYEKTAEVSRLLITKNIRRPTEYASSRRPRVANQRQATPHHGRMRAAVLVDLIRAMAAYSCEHGIPQWVFFATPALARILRRLGISLIEIGAPRQHRGIRFPYVTEAEQIYDTLTLATEREGNKDPLSPPYQLFSELSSATYPHNMEGPMLKQASR